MTANHHLTTDPFDDDKLKEECGVFGIWGHGEAPELTALGLHALQHRGQEAAGIVTFDKKKFWSHRDLGHVGAIFGSEEVMEKLHGKAAIGHNRYATAGDTWLRNVQPLFADLQFGGFAIAHNGNLTNAFHLRKKLVEEGALFQSTTDTEVILHLMSRARAGGVVDRLIEALRQIEGAYSLVALADDMVIGVRDPHGVRPLVLGKLGDAYVLASETSALDIIAADYIRDIEPGELVVLDKDGLHTQRPFPDKPPRFCIFEYIYFARPDSTLEGRNVYQARKAIGRELAREAPAPDRDDVIVVPVPDSGVPAALGFAEESGHPFELGIIRSHYIGRTFIEPSQQIRNFGVRLKHSPNRDFIRNKTIILVDDSLVRGTTSKKIVTLMREAGAREVHMRISSPPTAHSCFYGIDTPSTEELMAHKYSVKEIQKEINVDSLSYLSVDGLYRALGEAARNKDNPQFCDACFTGDYAIQLIDRATRDDQDTLSYLSEKRIRK